MKTILILATSLLFTLSCKKTTIEPQTMSTQPVSYIAEIWMNDGGSIQHVYINGILKSYIRPTSYLIKTGDIIRCENITSTKYNCAYAIINIEGKEVLNTIMTYTQTISVDTTYTVK